MKDDILCLPSIRKLERLSKNFNMETDVNDNTLSYLTARTAKLTEYERNVVVIEDEIYTAQQVEYSSGKIAGFEDGQATKILLCFMVSLVAGRIGCHNYVFFLLSI